MRISDRSRRRPSSCGAWISPHIHRRERASLRGRAARGALSRPLPPSRSRASPRRGRELNTQKRSQEVRSQQSRSMAPSRLVGCLQTSAEMSMCRCCALCTLRSAALRSPCARLAAMAHFLRELTAQGEELWKPKARRSKRRQREPSGDHRGGQVLHRRRGRGGCRGRRGRVRGHRGHRGRHRGRGGHGG